ncbi:hypothetical protein XENOCAPTIV_015542 [Xenoophorus captivus]|uniref:Uncharacterized protein n=1 Tax=Xenoophorus captivus TaxID=1517983 RepID=A0ABV0S7X1_9TELE
MCYTTVKMVTRPSNVKHKEPVSYSRNMQWSMKIMQNKSFTLIQMEYLLIIKYSVWESMRRSLYTETLYSERGKEGVFNVGKGGGKEGGIAAEVLMRATCSGVFKPGRNRKREHGKEG